ncbi:MAG: phosphatidate cytidylyltransferase [Acidobacteriia bacterium]|nr:phosphatidate cytidylyltransferase [Terriglobia bacterium]
MKRVLTAVVLIPVVLLLVFKAPLWLFALALAAIVVLSIHEYLNVIKGYGIQPMIWLTYLTSLALIAVLLFDNDPHFARLQSVARSFPIVPFLPLVFGIPLVFRHDMHMAFPAAGSSAFAVLYLALPLGLLIPLRNAPDAGFLVLFALLSVWAGDTAAYYVGRNLGRLKLAPVVSPKKTWEGAIASVVASVGVALLIFHFRGPLNSLFSAGPALHHDPSLAGTEKGLALVSIIALGIITNVAAQFGDLFESVLKRGANIKDSGTLLPGHGGILDRIDALLFAIPVVWYYANLTGFLQSNSLK